MSIHDRWPKLPVSDDILAVFISARDVINTFTNIRTQSVPVVETMRWAVFHALFETIKEDKNLDANYI